MHAEKIQSDLRECLAGLLEYVDDAAAVESNLRKMVARHHDPNTLIELFRVDPTVLSTLVPLIDGSPRLADQLIADPKTFDLCAASESGPAESAGLKAELNRRLASIDQPTHAAMVIRKFFSRHVFRIAYGEFVCGHSPDVAGRQLAHVADAILDGGLQFTLRHLHEIRGVPQRPDGTTPEVTIIGLGNLGGEELSYAAPMKIVLLYDAIDHKNVWHRKFYAAVVDDLVRLLCGNRSRKDGFDIDLREGPRHEVGVHICGFREAARIYETSGRTFQRLSFIRARIVAGSEQLGKAFLARLEPWIFRQFISRVERSEVRSLRHKLQRHVQQGSSADGVTDIVLAAGGRGDLELTVQLLQLVYGGHDRTVRARNTLDAINGMHRAGHLSDEDQTLLSETYARLCRLQHQLSISFENRGAILPTDSGAKQRLARQLGIRDPKTENGDVHRFDEILKETFDRSRDLISRLLLESLEEDSDTPAETDLLLDPDPDPAVIEQTLRHYQLKHPRSAMADLASLSTETVPFLSPLRCRHIFSSIAPKLLDEVSKTPDPDAALHSMVKVTESLGAKATLWELLGAHQPTMQLVVRLCATTPYLSGILTDNPGMIDELVDSLVMNRLPSADRLDAHSIELCKGAADIDDILFSFKFGAHLMIGVRDMLGKETMEATHQAIGDTAEAVVRRVIEYEQEIVAGQFGDPIDDDGRPSQMIVLALGKFGGREPNYHSDLDTIFLYSVGGQTQRRIGGRRLTTTNHRFFNQVARKTVDRINRLHPSGRLYELDSRLRPVDQSGPMAVSVDDFLQQFQTDSAPLWMRMALCKARAISGSRAIRKRTDQAVVDAIASTRWIPAMATQIRAIRSQLEQTAAPENLKRGVGGTIDVEHVAQLLTLRHAKQAPQVIRQGTTESIEALAEAGFLAPRDASALLDGYRTLRRTEASLRLMNAPARHALPSDAGLMDNLAFLIGAAGPEEIVARCREARRVNREIFGRIFDAAAPS